jgi:hypothetical protein
VVVGCWENCWDAQALRRHRSPFSERPLGRFLRAEALTRLERDQEALNWFSTLGWIARESVWVAQVQLRQGDIYERLAADRPVE